MEEGDNRSTALEEISKTGEEGVVLEESMTGSPSNVLDGLSGPNATADAGSRQTNGTSQYIYKCQACNAAVWYNCRKFYEDS